MENQRQMLPSNPEGQKVLERKEYDVPPQIIRPFGVWLAQQLKRFSKETGEPPDFQALAKETNPSYANFYPIMEGDLKDINLTADLFQRSKEAKLCPETDTSDQWGLYFSPITEDMETAKITSTKITLTPPFKRPVINAFEDVIRRKITNLKGFSEIILTRSNPPEEVATELRRINSASTDIEKLVDALASADEIRIEVDENGKVEITPIPKPDQPPAQSPESTPPTPESPPTDSR